MDNITIIRKRITHKMKTRKANVKINCNMTISKIFDVIKFSYFLNFVPHICYAIITRRVDLTVNLYFDIQHSLVNDFIPFVKIILSFTYIGFILNGKKLARSFLLNLYIMPLSFI